MIATNESLGKRERGNGGESIKKEGKYEEK